MYQRITCVAQQGSLHFSAADGDMNTPDLLYLVVQMLNVVATYADIGDMFLIWYSKSLCDKPAYT